jgi:glycosyltransferase involved in cell wall biosynthesis
MSAKYDVAHIHGNSATSFLELAALSKVPVRIVHNHNSITEHPFINAVLKPFFLKSYTQAVACSELAGDWLFGKGQFKVLRNAIDVDRFKPNSERRKQIRQLFGIADDEIVVGNVGKIIKQKNHSFIIDVFAEYRKINFKSKLLLIGTGNLEDAIKEKIVALGLQKFVVMAGLRTDIPDMMCAMDVFLFPSLWEGLPLAALEAQASGLPVFISSVISSEVCISENCYVLSLEEKPSVWAKAIYEKANVGERTVFVERNEKSLAKAGYNIRNEAKELRQLYNDKEQ